MVTKGYRDRVRKTALVTTNDPGRQRFTIALEAQVKAVFDTSPEFRFRLNTKVGQPAEETILLTSNLPGPVEIAEVSHNMEPFGQVKLEVLEPGRRFSLTLSTKAQETTTRGGLIDLKLKNAPVDSFQMTALIAVNDEKGKDKD